MIAGSLNRLNRKGRTASGPSGPPRLNSTTATLRPAISGLQPRRQPLHVGDRRLLDDPVAEVEHPRPAAPLLQELVDAPVERVAAGQQEQGIQRALDAQAPGLQAPAEVGR